MGTLEPLGDRHRDAVRDIQRIVTHVLARRLFAVSGRFGLRPSPGGIATPAFGAHDESLRLAGMQLIRERRVDGAMTSAAMAIDGASLAALARFAGSDLSIDLSVGSDTPPLGDPDAPIRVDEGDAMVLASWFSVAAIGLDVILGHAGQRSPSGIQLWPEHFDLAVDMGAGAGRVNLGASPGDDSCDEPYVYLGPWGPERPGDADYWNVGFGAQRRYGVLRTTPDPGAAMVEFWMRGLAILDREEI